MKKIFKITALSLVLSFGVISVQNCNGSFAITKKLHNWNSSLGDKFIESAVTWGMIIIPVYGVGMLIDFVALNTIEFWTGSNPLAMGPNEKETKLVKVKDKSFEITASQNRFDIKSLNEESYGIVTTMVFEADDSTWYLVSKEGQRSKLASLQPGETTMKLYHPDHGAIEVEL